MTTGARASPFEPFFLPAASGERFCIYHPAATSSRGGILYLHPFAEEMNKSRRMAALQCRKLAALGYAVLQIDLYGCGDSSGDFGDASWDIWRQDVVLGTRWLRQNVGGSVTLWGLRLGGLLALDAAGLCDPVADGYILWQPVLSGESMFTQFLRIRVASEMLSGRGASAGVDSLRASLAAGEVVEVAGYALTSRLAKAIDGLRLADLAPSGRAVHWLEIVPEAGRALPPAAQRVVDLWSRNGVQPEVQCVAGQPFWNTQEITECPALVAATTQIFGERVQ